MGNSLPLEAFYYATIGHARDSQPFMPFRHGSSAEVETLHRCGGVGYSVDVSDIVVSNLGTVLLASSAVDSLYADTVEARLVDVDGVGLLIDVAA